MNARRGKLTGIRFERSPDDYDLIVIGTPIWAGRMTPAARTYLGSRKLEGKRVAFFCTSGSEGGKVLEELKGLAPKSEAAGCLGLTAAEVKAGTCAEKVKAFAESLRK